MKTIILLIAVSFFVSCKKDSIHPKPYPQPDVSVTTTGTTICTMSINDTVYGTGQIWGADTSQLTSQYFTGLVVTLHTYSNQFDISHDRYIDIKSDANQLTSVQFLFKKHGTSATVIDEIKSAFAYPINDSINLSIITATDTLKYTL